MSSATKFSTRRMVFTDMLIRILHHLASSETLPVLTDCVKVTRKVFSAKSSTIAPYSMVQ